MAEQIRHGATLLEERREVRGAACEVRSARRGVR